MKNAHLLPQLPTGSLDILDHMPIGVVLLRPDGHLVYANPAMVHMLGYAGVEELPDDPTEMYMAGREREEWLRRIQADGEVRGFSTQMRRKDGEAVWVEINAVCMKDASGQALYIEGGFLDISERMQTEMIVEQMTALLRESESRYLGLFENSPVALWEEDFSGVKQYIERLKAQGVTDFNIYLARHPEVVDECLGRVRVEDVNQTTLRFYRAHTKSELLANLGKVLGQETRKIFAEELLVIAEGGTVFESEGQNRTIDGEVMDIHLRWAVAPGYEDSYAKVFVSTIDISERKRAERRERARAERSAALAQISHEILAAGLDSQAIYGAVVARVAALLGDACALGVLSDNQPGVRVVAFRHQNSRAHRRLVAAVPEWPEGLADKILRSVVESGASVYLPEVSETQLADITPPGCNFGQYFKLSSLIVAPLGSPGAVIGVIAAMRERKGGAFSLDDLTFLNQLAGYITLTILNAQLHDLVRRQAQTDALTGLYNRSYFIRLAEREFARSQRFGHALAAVMFDLDHFKSINDTYGHPAGDEVLRRVSERCREMTRAYDIFGRFGGEEFMILMPETDLDGAFVVAERLRQAVDCAPIVAGEQEIHVTISLGVAAVNEMTATLPALLAQVDAAMYAAKYGGRNRVAR